MPGFLLKQKDILFKRGKNAQRILCLQQIFACLKMFHLKEARQTPETFVFV